MNAVNRVSATLNVIFLNDHGGREQQVRAISANNGHLFVLLRSVRHRVQKRFLAFGACVGGGLFQGARKRWTGIQEPSGAMNANLGK